MKIYKKRNSSGKWCRSLVSAFAVITFCLSNVYAQHVFSVSYSKLPTENARQMSMQIERARTAIAPLSRNMNGEYAFSFSANENTQIILLNEQTGKNVVITPTEHAPAEFVLSPFFLEEMRQAILGNADRLLIIETGIDFSIPLARTSVRAVTKS